MKGETKLFLGIIVGTIALVGAAVFFFSKPGSPPVTSTKVDHSLLERPDSNKIASGSATVTLVEFGDFQCPSCGAYHSVVKQLVSDLHESLAFVFRNFPLEVHTNSHIAAQAVEAAGLQKKYWEMYDLVYEKQRDWSDSNVARDVFAGYAQSLGLDGEKFKKDIDSDVVKKKIDEDVNDGTALGVSATPTFYLNDEKIGYPASLADFETLVKAAILKAPKPSITATEKVHMHFNFLVFTNGKQFDFSQAKYQSKDGKDINETVHFHDGKGDLVHIHAAGVKLGDFITSLGMSLTKDCFVDDTKNNYCNDSASTLKMFVNGKPNTEFSAYEPKDLDRILVSYGSDTDVVLQQQLGKVGDDACIYSEKCPERGKPPTENCVGGLGTGCTD